MESYDMASKEEYEYVRLFEIASEQKPYDYPEEERNGI